MTLYRFFKRLSCGTGLALALNATVAASEPKGPTANQSGPTHAEAYTVIREPSQGRPIFITPGETFYFVMQRGPQVHGDVRFLLRHAIEPTVRVPLKATTPPSYNDEYCSMVLMVPAEATPGLYDLELAAPGGNFYSRRSVKIVDTFRTEFRFVHLSNMNIGDLTAPAFDDTLPREINLLAPEFIIATGDYTEWARARDDATSWRTVLTYFQQFNAPVFMLCGQHDHQESFTQYVASRPIGTIDYGAYHGLLLLDHPGSPIDQDFSQLQWIENDLRRNKNKKLTFLCTNSDELALLDIWRANGNLETFIEEYKIRLFLTGGSTDWDFKEFADRLKGVPTLQFVRTHQSSTSLRDRALGISHYRVIEVKGDQLAFVYPDDNAAEKLQHSIPSGRLRTFFDSPNDGTAARVGVTIQNALNQGFDNAQVWLRVAKKGDAKPTIEPGRVLNTLDAGDYWACNVAVDVPDKSAVRLVASNNADDVPPALPIDVAFEGPREWSFSPKSTQFGLSYFTCPEKVTLNLTNRAKSTITCWPIIRVNGGELHPDRKAVPRLPLTLEPGKTTPIPLVLQLRRISPGPHAMQIHFLEDPLSRLTTFNVTLAAAPQ
ncbi:hypothetical protein RAS2_12630 [Phycisphaerae bacterium RAS2]|nr:hypothetical protein RAS2_12630 [Phycisphaerae bacterium RAS2]